MIGIRPAGSRETAELIQENAPILAKAFEKISFSANRIL
jgi:hypothetical protein